MSFINLKNKIKRILSGHEGAGEPDWPIMVVVGIILIFGLIMLASATPANAYVKYGDSYYFLKHQLFGVAVGLAAAWFFSNLNYHRLKDYSFTALFVSVLLLLLVFIPGLSANYGKARSWINVFGFSLQPSEFVKISFLVYLSSWLESKKKIIHDLKHGAGPFVAVLSVIGLLMLLQPDLGTLSIIALTSLILFYIGGADPKHILVFIGGAFILLLVLIQIKPYQADRFRCWWDPSWSAKEKCYQVDQALIAVGSGGFWGRGLGESRQKFMYIPEVSGDSIFAIISEETGWIFSTALIGLFLILFYRGYKIASRAPDDFGRYLALGIVTWLALQAIINIGGVINFMPMTGVPLPFVSYGGSAILAALSAIGILINISKHTKTYNM